MGREFKVITGLKGYEEITYLFKRELLLSSLNSLKEFNRIDFEKFEILQKMITSEDRDNMYLASLVIEKLTIEN